MDAFGLSAHYLRAGFDASGKLTAWQHRLVGDRVAPFADPVRYEKAGKKDFILMLGADAKGYDVPHQLVEQVYEDTGIRTAPLRGIGFTANKFATETFMDEIAYKCGIDPMRYRLHLLAKTPRAHTVLERVAHKADWGRSRNGHGLGTAYIDLRQKLCARHRSQCLRGRCARTIRRTATRRAFNEPEGKNTGPSDRAKRWRCRSVRQINGPPTSHPLRPPRNTVRRGPSYR
jgi:hypothetical protein